ncbi:unnamed protein product [Echinostoma caproni]|uniref:DUF2428 domain-containing protein n=1 Tax=Echinostoma caproni TaxID=27848 RepID=A0A183AN57_9TREM|nr:unnamed protein product [Echinostoma caproni]
MTRLSSETALIRRAMAQLLVLTCQHSRFALPLLQTLLQRVLAELAGVMGTISSQRRGGLLNTLRYLSIAWHEVLSSSPNGLLGEYPPPSLRPGSLVSSSTVRSPPTSNSMKPKNGYGDDLAPDDGFQGNSAIKTAAQSAVSRNEWAEQLCTQEHELTESIEQLWSFAFLVCLDSASSRNGITVCTAALEALLQLLQSGYPIRLYPHRWLVDDVTWLTATIMNTGWSASLSVSSYEPSLIDSSSPWLESDSTRLLSLRELLTQLITPHGLNKTTLSSRSDYAFSLPDCHWLLEYLVLQFCLIPNMPDVPRPDVLPRTSSQLLVVACLSQLTQLYPHLFLIPLRLDRCCSSMTQMVPGPTPVSLILDLLEFHSDPQLRGQLCVLAGNVISSFLVTCSLKSQSVRSDPAVGWPAWSDVQLQLGRLLAGLDAILSTENAGTTVRLAVVALACSANAILQSPDAHGQSSSSPSLVALLLQCLARHLVRLARHSYRLVRREFMLMVAELDWHQILFMESRPQTKTLCPSLTRPVRLIDLAWIECWRLLSDPEGELRAISANTLLILSTVLTAAGDDLLATPKHTRLMHGCLERRLHYWFSRSYLFAYSPTLSYGLTECWSPQSFPPCLSDLPAELDVGPGSLLHHVPGSYGIRLPHLELINGADLSNRVLLAGPLRLFRECVAALLELPCASLIPDDRYMLHGVIRCLNRILGQTSILAHSRVWYDQCVISIDQPDSSDPPSSLDAGVTPNPSVPSSLLDRQRRPRIALLSWHCLTLLSATNVTAVDLELHTELVSLTTGCLLRWAIHALTEGSIPTGLASMSLDLQHAYTRFALSFLHHVARVLFVLWHVVDEVSPSPAPSTGLIADPFHPDAPIGILNSITILAQTGANAVAQATQAAANKAVQGAAAAANVSVVSVQSGGGRRGLKLNSPLRKTVHGKSLQFSSVFTTINHALSCAGFGCCLLVAHLDKGPR